VAVSRAGHEAVPYQRRSLKILEGEISEDATAEWGKKT
jgi:hypothetical protein